MTTLEVLKSKAANDAATKTVEMEQRAGKSRAELRQWIVRCFGEAILDEFQVEFGNHGSAQHAYTEFHYRGASRRFDIAGYDMAYSLNEGALLGWCKSVDEEIEAYNAERERKRTEIVEYAQENPRCLHRQWDDAIAHYRLCEFPEVEAAIAAADARAAEIEAERERQEREEEELRIEKAVGRLDQAKDYYDINSFDDYHEYDRLRQDERVQAARGRAIERADQNTRDEVEREDRRVQAEAEAFWPFVYYRVHYGVVATCDDETFVETETIDCLRPEPNGEGWWTPISGNKNQVRLAHLVKVERRTVASVDELPKEWKSTRETEYGKIRVPPEAAERARA